jgi:hypothetical protein
MFVICLSLKFRASHLALVRKVPNCNEFVTSVCAAYETERLFSLVFLYDTLDLIDGLEKFAIFAYILAVMRL